MSRLAYSISYILIAACVSLAERPISGLGQPVFTDSFERQEIGNDWLIPIQQFSIRQGYLQGHELPERGHGAVIRKPFAFQDAVVQFRFRIVDGKIFNFVINDKNCKDVHAGHICRFSISSSLVRLADDKEGAMKNEIFEMRKDPAKANEARELAKQHEIRVPNKLAKDQWHVARVSMIGEVLTVWINDKEIGKLTGKGIAHPTKTDFGLTVLGNLIEFDDVQAWRLK